MEIVFLLLTIFGIIIALVFGYLQVVVPFTKGEVRFSKRLPFVETAEAPAAKLKKRKRKKRKRFFIPGLAIGILIVLFVLVRFLVFQAKAIERVPIAVINFTNHTGDEQFDYLCAAIPNLLITNLEQSKHLSVLTWERMRDLLKILGKEDVPTVDEDLGFEICEMDDIQTVITGSFTKAGNMFVTEVKVLDVASKKILKTSTSQGEGVASILKIQIDELSQDIAGNVSIYERVVTPTEMQVADVTTTSMEAYNYYLKGKEQYNRYYWANARKFLQKAIEIDSTFVSAYLSLAVCSYILEDVETRDAALKRAKALSGKATEKDRLAIEADYANYIEGDREKYYRIIQQMARKYPKEKTVYTRLARMYRDTNSYHEAIEELHKALELDPNFWDALNLLGYMYIEVGEYTKAIECFKRYASVMPGEANPFDSMGDAYLAMDQLDEAIAQYKQAVFVKPKWPAAKDKIAYIYALQEDYAEALIWCDSLVNTDPWPGVWGYVNRAYYRQLLGNTGHALSDLDTASIRARKLSKYVTAMVELIRALIYYHNGDFQMSKHHFKACHDNLDAPVFGTIPDKSYNTIYYNFFLGLVDIKQNNLDSADARLAITKPLLPEVAIKHKNGAQYLNDLLYAEVLLARDSIEKSIMVGENSLKYKTEMQGYSDYDWEEPHVPQDVIARAYLKKGDTDRAILEYEKLVDPDVKRRGLYLVQPIWHYELAKLYDEQGDRTKAINEYGKFLDIWKNADADRPELIDANKRLANLKARS